jgi:peptide deformylase
MRDTKFELNITGETKIDRPNKRLKIVGSDTFEYELFKLVDERDAILRIPAAAFDFSNPILPPAYLALSLVETMRGKYGIGIAAPQAGLATRVIALGGFDHRSPAYVMFNPILLESSGEVKMQEGCLSFPGLFLNIKREATVKVAWFEADGKEKEQEFSGLTARVILHEMDHLDGVCFTTLVPALTLELAKGRVKKNLKKLKRQHEEEMKKELMATAMKNLYLDGLKQKFPANPDPNAVIPT